MFHVKHGDNLVFIEICMDIVFKVFIILLLPQKKNNTLFEAEKGGKIFYFFRNGAIKNKTIRIK